LFPTATRAPRQLAPRSELRRACPQNCPATRPHSSSDTALPRSSASRCSRVFSPWPRPRPRRAPRPCHSVSGGVDNFLTFVFRWGSNGRMGRWCSLGQCMGKSGVPSPPDDSPDPPAFDSLCPSCIGSERPSTTSRLCSTSPLLLLRRCRWGYRGTLAGTIPPPPPQLSPG
jgi:hypothetical protein